MRSCGFVRGFTGVLALSGLTTALLTTTLLIATAQSAAAQSATLYSAPPENTEQAAINAALHSMTRQALTLTLPGIPISADVTAWLQSGLPRKIRVVYPDGDSRTTLDFYYTSDQNQAQLASVTDVLRPALAGERTKDRAPKDRSLATQRNLYLFHRQHMVRWLDGENWPVSPVSADFFRRERDLLTLSAVVLSALDGSRQSDAIAPPTPVHETTGVFVGLVPGQETAIRLRTAQGEMDFTVQDADDGLDRLIGAPEHSIGQTVTVLWRPAPDPRPGLTNTPRRHAISARQSRK